MADSPVSRDLENTAFSTALRGYDREEVDAFVRTVAQEMQGIQRQHTEKLYENLGEEMGSLLQHARDSADQMTRESDESTAATRAAAEADAKKTREEADADARKTRKEAGEVAADLRAEAERDASTRIAEADEAVRRLEAIEAQARTRIKALRIELGNLTQQLQELELTERADMSSVDDISISEELEHRTIRLEPEAESTVS